MKNKSLRQENLVSLFRGLAIFSASLYIFGLFAQGISGPKYFGLYLLILSALIVGYFDRKNIQENINELFKIEKLLFISLVVLIAAILITSYLSLCDSNIMLKGARRSLLNISLFFFALLPFINDKRLSYSLMISLVLASAYNVLYYAYDFYTSNPAFDMSKFWSRDFSFRFELNYPFLLIAIFLRKRWMFAIIPFLLLGLILDILTGARGGWLSIASSTLVFAFILYRYDSLSRRKILIVSVIVATFATAFISYSYLSGGYVKKKLDRGLLNTSGRNFIVKDRLPIFLKDGRLLIGIGGPSNYCYNQFLNERHAPHRLGRFENGSFHFYADEPFFLNVFYKEGLLGLVVLLWTLGILTWRYIDLIRTIRDRRLLLFAIASFSAFFSYYFVRSLVEGRGFKYIILFSALYLVLRSTEWNIAEKKE